jgi:3-methyladenine DNA glycosylase AlkD
MATMKRSTSGRSAKPVPGGGAAPLGTRVSEILGALERLSSEKDRAGLARYGIVTEKAMGVPMNAMQSVAKSAGRSHELALALWATGWYEARIVAAYVDEPARVTPAQMDRWARDFDNWGICDTVCFVLFDKTPHAFGRVASWAGRSEEFVKRAAFALLASLALHDKESSDAAFRRCLPLAESAAADERNFVKKGVLWALRAVGGRNTGLREAVLALARRLADAPGVAARWIGRNALRELSSPAERRRQAARRGRARARPGRRA